jgi:hypothetical protein
LTPLEKTLSQPLILPFILAWLYPYHKPGPQIQATLLMKLPKHPTLIRRSLEARRKALQAQGPVLAASLVIIKRRCGNPRCRCTRGQRHPGFYLTRLEKGKTKTTYVPVDLVPEVRQWIQEYKRLKELIAQMTQLSLGLVRTHVKTRRRKGARS